jgi:hypothetical protein
LAEYDRVASPVKAALRPASAGAHLPPNHHSGRRTADAFAGPLGLSIADDVQLAILNFNPRASVRAALRNIRLRGSFRADCRLLEAQQQLILWNRLSRRSKR